MTHSSKLSKRDAYILEQFGGHTYEPNRMDVQEGRLWDSFEFQPGSVMQPSTTDLFSDRYGTNNKIYADTNMSMSRRLPAPEAFSVQRVLFSFSRDCNDSDVFALAERLVWRLNIGKRYYLRQLIIAMRPFDNMVAPFRVCDFCRAVYVQSPTCPGCGARSFNLVSSIGGTIDSAGKQFLMELSQPIVIYNQVDFHVDFEHFQYQPKHYVKMWCHLEGLHARGVQ